MEKANKFFFLDGVSDNVKCDFDRFDDQTLLFFCHVDDKACRDRLNVSIRTETAIDTDSQQTIKNHFVSYELINETGTIKQAESLPIRIPSFVWACVVRIVNDVFK